MVSIPFSGNKRYSYKNVKKIVEDGGYKEVYEPFGGSCVLSVNLKNDNVVDKAVANDFDRFFDLYPEYLDLKDKVVELGYANGFRRVSHNPKLGNCYMNPDGTREPAPSRILPEDQIVILQNIIEEHVPKKFWRHFAHGCNFTHSCVGSHEEVKLKDFRQFSAYLKSDKQRAFYKALQNIELEHLDYKDFLEKHKSSLQKKDAILILDPPYVGTAQRQYGGTFTEAQTIELIKTVKEIGCDFIFFNNNPEQIKQWLSGLNPIMELTGNSTSTCNKRRKDVMAYVRRDR